jgi:hypothetical protein
MCLCEGKLLAALVLLVTCDFFVHLRWFCTAGASTFVCLVSLVPYNGEVNIDENKGSSRRASIFTAAVFVFAIVGQDLFRKLAPEKFGSFKMSLYTVWRAITR